MPVVRVVARARRAAAAVAPEVAPAGGHSASDHAHHGLPVFTALQGGLQLRQVAHAEGPPWFGFEGNNAVVDGLWQRPLDAYLDFIAANGFNAIRLPLATTTSCQPHAGRVAGPPI